MTDQGEIRGLYRTTGFAYVTNDRMAFIIPEKAYRAHSYSPDFDELPTKDAYHGRQNPGSKERAK